MDYFDGLSFSVAGLDKKRSGIKTNLPKYYGVQFFYTGGVYLQVDLKKEYELDAPAVFLTYPGRRFDYGPMAETGQHYCICFCGPRVERYIKSGLFHLDQENPLIEIRHADKFQASINELLMLLKNPAESNSNRAVLLLEDILLQIYEQNEALKKKIPVFQKPFFEDLLIRIRKSPWKDWDFDAEARKLHISKNHFGRLFKDFCSYAPQEFVIQSRLALAAELLTDTADSVREIASKIGIENEFYFSRLFKKRYHLSPREYRRELVGKPV